jgi:exopolysaccharide biosynthesis operon protein EpsL
MEVLVTLPMRPRIIISNIVLVLMPAILSAPSPLWAAPEDTVQAYASTSITNDDNLLRLSKDADIQAVTGQPSAADTIKQGTVGVKVDWKQDRQEVILDASLNESRFTRFTLLNYQASNIQSRWNWQLGNSLSGDIGYNRNTTLGSFAELQSLVNNLNTLQNEFIDSAWQVRPDWRLNGAISHATYSVTSYSFYGNESMNYTVGAYFTPSGGNEIGIKDNRQVQKYPVLQPVDSPGTLVDNGFTQDQLLATVNWLYSGHIRLNGQAGMVNRSQNQLTERNFSGNTMRGTLTWLASGKSQVDLTAWNEIDPYDDLTTSYTQSKGISLGPTWNPTGKLVVSARLQHLNRYFLGDPLLILYPWLLIPVRHDTVNTANLSVNYQPVRNVNISTSIQIEHRNSNPDYLYGNYGYADKTVNMNMSFAF